MYLSDLGTSALSIVLAIMNLVMSHILKDYDNVKAWKLTHKDTQNWWKVKISKQELFIEKITIRR